MNNYLNRKCYDNISFISAFKRYGNIVPYNHNRVTLDNELDGIDYVNASWIKNAVLTPQMPNFIAAQGVNFTNIFTRSFL